MGRCADLFSKAALDRGYAALAPMGTPRPVSHSRVALVFAGNRDPSLTWSVFGYLGAYFALRFALTWMVGIWGLKQDALWKKLALIPVWDALAFVIWLTSFTRNSIRWRDSEYYIRDGRLVPVVQTNPEPAG